MSRAMRECDKIIAKAGAECDLILRREVEKVMRASGRYSGFAAAMGTVCFYGGKDGRPFFDEDLSKAALAVVRLGQELTGAFGSPGFQVHRDGADLKWS